MRPRSLPLLPACCFISRGNPPRVPEGGNDPLVLEDYLHEQVSPIFEELSRNNQDDGCVFHHPTS